MHRRKSQGFSDREIPLLRVERNGLFRFHGKFLLQFLVLLISLALFELRDLPSRHVSVVRCGLLRAATVKGIVVSNVTPYSLVGFDLIAWYHFSEDDVPQY
jgi:hypothetical protein